MYFKCQITELQNKKALLIIEISKTHIALNLLHHNNLPQSKSTSGLFYAPEKCASFPIQLQNHRVTKSFHLERTSGGL